MLATLQKGKFLGAQGHRHSQGKERGRPQAWIQKKNDRVVRNLTGRGGGLSQGHSQGWLRRSSPRKQYRNKVKFYFWPLKKYSESVSAPSQAVLVPHKPGLWLRPWSELYYDNVKYVQCINLTLICSNDGEHPRTTGRSPLFPAPEPPIFLNVLNSCFESK